MTIKAGQIDFTQALGAQARLVNETLAELLVEYDNVPQNLKKAISYTLEAGGKRLRAVLVLWCCELVCGEITQGGRIAAAAIEMVHTYSLVHDDLPAMDDDDFRRGRPSCHKAFDEATAILVGDALLTMAFEVLAERVESSDMAVRLIKTLSEAAGPKGMVAGQMADSTAANTKGDIDILKDIHTNKTAKMFAAAAIMGGLAGDASVEEIDALGRFGLKLGLGFQIADDILDVLGTSEHLGKTAGKDVAQGKLTYPAVLGIDESRRQAKRLADEAIGEIETFGAKAAALKELVMILLERTK